MVPNLKIRHGELPERVIVCGDQGRAKDIAGILTQSSLLAMNREYHSYVGKWNGVDLAVVSHGVGASGAAVCFEELIQAGAKTIIRVGTAGSYTVALPPGSIVISSGAVRRDGFTNQYVPEGYPAIASSEITSVLKKCASIISDQVIVKEGITLTLDVFYNGAIPFPHEQYKKAGVLAVEMENSALFTIASLRGVRAGSILAIDGFADVNLSEEYNPDTSVVKFAVQKEIEIALHAITSLNNEAM